MSDHHTSYTVNAMLGRLHLKNKAFQSLKLADQQSIVLDLIEGAYRSDVNIGEILSEECFLNREESNEKRTIGTIFQICSYCGKPKDNVEDYDIGHSMQSFCPDCASINKF